MQIEVVVLGPALDLLGEVMRVDDRGLDPVRHQERRGVVEHRDAADRGQGLRAVVGEGSQAGPETRREEESAPHQRTLPEGSRACSVVHDPEPLCQAAPA